MGANTLGRWIGRMVVVAAVSAGVSLGAGLAIDADPNYLDTVADTAPATDDPEASTAAHEWQ